MVAKVGWCVVFWWCRGSKGEVLCCGGGKGEVVARVKWCGGGKGEVVARVKCGGNKGEVVWCVARPTYLSKIIKLIKTTTHIGYKRILKFNLLLFLILQSSALSVVTALV